MSSLSFDDLFALRIELSDEFLDENLIIKELKMILMRNGFDDMEAVNNYLVEFYNNFGIEMDIETIRNINIQVNPTINFINQLINQNYVNQNSDDNNPPINPIFNLISPFPNPSNVEEDDDENEEINNNQNNSISMNQFMNNFNFFLQSINNMPPPQPMEDVRVVLKDEGKIKKYKLEKKLDEKCAVCLGVLDKDNLVWELKCNHIFHQDCIKTWLKEYNYKCPVCREEAGEGETDI